MFRKSSLYLLAILLMACIGGPARAHFGMLIPSDTMIMPQDNKILDLKLSFSHPFEGKGIELIRPEIFAVAARGKSEDLLEKVHKSHLLGHTAWEARYRVGRPGVYAFYMVPKPYWEPAEDCYIVHYTKTIVAAFGWDAGWDEEIGLKTEIVPLAKPYGLYAGNVFQGIVKLDGQPVPYATVEVEYFNESGRAQAPTDYMITQSIKADGNGVFTYAAPRAGWWGFAALNTADKTIERNGEEKNVELGAVIWVKFHDWKMK